MNIRKTVKMIGERVMNFFLLNLLPKDNKLVIKKCVCGETSKGWSSWIKRSICNEHKIKYAKYTHEKKTQE